MNAESVKLSIIVPVFNEANTIRTILKRVVRAPFTKEIIVVDDGSQDQTVEILRDQDSLIPLLSQSARAPFDLKILVHDFNLGKGAAIRTAISAITGDIVL